MTCLSFMGGDFAGALRVVSDGVFGFRGCSVGCLYCVHFDCYGYNL